MKKDNYYDYVTEAFRYYAYCGKPKSKELRELRTQGAKAGCGKLSDLEAVLRTVERLQTEPDGVQSLSCLEMVYFEKPSHYPKRSELTQRIENASLALGLSVSSINRRLRRIRMLMAIERGLRIEDSEAGGLLG